MREVRAAARAVRSCPFFVGRVVPLSEVSGAFPESFLAGGQFLPAVAA